MARGIIDSEDKLKVATSSKHLSSRFKLLVPLEYRFITGIEVLHALCGFRAAFLIST